MTHRPVVIRQRLTSHHRRWHITLPRFAERFRLYFSVDGGTGFQIAAEVYDVSARQWTTLGWLHDRDRSAWVEFATGQYSSARLMLHLDGTGSVHALAVVTPLDIPTAEAA